MKRSVANLIKECDSRMNGYSMLLNYKYMNLCVKAEAASLLSVTVEYDGEHMDIEQVADVTIAPDDFHFQAYPKEPGLILVIAKAIKKAHPEFGVDIKNMEEAGNTEQADDADRYILITMPEVNDDRHDLLVNAVKTLYDECKVKLDLNFQDYSVKLVTFMAGSDAKEVDEAKDILGQVNDSYADMIKGFREEKEKEIEDAYQKYLVERNQREQQEHEQAAAHGVDKGRSLKLPEEKDE